MKSEVIDRRRTLFFSIYSTFKKIESNEKPKRKDLYAALKDLDEEKAEWIQFKETTSDELWVRIVDRYALLVRSAVNRVRLSIPVGVGRGDLIDFAFNGLFEAIEDFDPALGDKFTPYAMPKISASIRRQIRNLNWLPMSVRKQFKKIERLRKKYSGSRESEIERITISCGIPYDRVKVIERISSDQEIRKELKRSLRDILIVRGSPLQK